MKSSKCFAAAFLLSWSLPAQLWAAGLIGPEFQVNTFTSNFQRYPAVAADGAGNFVVVWEADYSQDGDHNGVFGQRFDSIGTALGTEFQINTYTTERQQSPAVAADSAGNFVVVWESRNQPGDNNYGIFGQRYDSAGTALGTEFQVNTYTTTPQFDPVVAADSAGNFVVVWTGQQDYGSSDGIFGRRFNSAGTGLGTEFKVNTFSTASQQHAAVASDGAGNFVVTWESLFQDGSGRGIFAQRYDSAGAADGTEFQTNSFTTGDQDYPAVAVDGAGNIVVVWTIYGEGVEGQRYDSAGTALGTEFEVSDGGNFDRYPSVAADSAGDFMVAWRSNDFFSNGVVGRHFDSTGAALGSEFRVNSYTTYSQSYPAIVAGAAGEFVVAWTSDDQDESDEGVFAQRLCTIATCTNGDGCCPAGCDSISDDDCPVPPTTTTTTTTLPAACGNAPALGCLDGEKASFQIKDGDDPKDQIKWKLKKADGFDQLALGDPATTRAYSLCVYDEIAGTPSLVATITIDPNASWEDKAPKGFSYKDKTGAEDGVTKASLKTGSAGKASVSVSAKGIPIPMPVPFGAEFFDMNTAVTVQLVNDETATCWTSEFTVAKTNTAEQFKANAP